jgi:hypothetical protein
MQGSRSHAGYGECRNMADAAQRLATETHGGHRGQIFIRGQFGRRMSMTKDG